MNFAPPDSLFVQCVNKEQEVGNKEYKIGEAFMSLADLFLGGGLYFRGVVCVRFFLYLCKLIVGR